MVESPEELLYDVSGLFFSEAVLLFAQLVYELAAGAQLHAQEHVLVVLVGFKVVYDVGVINLL